MNWLWVILLCYLAGLAMPIGASIATVERIHPKWLESEFRHSVIAFGGGALLSAVALVLVPDGSEKLGPLFSPLCMLAGAGSILGLEMVLARNESAAGQLVAMLTDFIPEAIALGAAFATGSGTGGAIALMIGLQNLPEGFNAYREIANGTSFSKAKILLSFHAMALAGPVAGLLGYHFLSHSPETIAVIELFASGGILYLIFQDIAPQVRLKNSFAPPLGAILGFALGLVGHLAIH